MGKPTGFMEYDRCEAASVDQRSVLRTLTSSMCSFQKKINRNRLPVVWTAEFLSASRE